MRLDCGAEVGAAEEVVMRTGFSGIVPNLALAVFLADAIVSRLPGSGTPSPWVVVGGLLVGAAIATAGRRPP